MVVFDEGIYQKVSAVTPGKVILFGEHFVVYGYPSIIASIERYFSVDISFYPEAKGAVQIISNLGFSATKMGIDIKFETTPSKDHLEIVSKLYKIIDYLNGVEVIQKDPKKGKFIIKLDSQLPLGGGLGSSSAFCVALAASFVYYNQRVIDKVKICKTSIDAEKLINIDTSGADCTVSTFGGLGRYDKKYGYTRIDSQCSDIEFLVVDTGNAHDTYTMIQKVSKIKENNPTMFSEVCDSYSVIYQEGLKCLQENNLERLGILLSKNHALLSKLSVSNNIIEKIVDICQSHGAFGTKITGAGGGGCIISLIDKKKDNKTLENRLKDLNLRYFFTGLNSTGIRII
ncbi:mevalonate kinase [Candidatus Nitrosocosmicus agrestis]|jgi:mevalonate kinase|uniref:mevalonate kinase n=1 Tax=Candidatus Nitrosocosmicus agrestis TaxID=2563600 RepID=UPI00122DEDCE|nr:mevalonate kinase [Candidatus Nitrosocosmicus sp. SS]KAA2279731.1 mevalonate kinase [Candidatus Nitrosocosmicus sp. SS]KAF0868803.1 mevalonate kinase [Candidatus Nitrosocosmicus sp. SS]